MELEEYDYEESDSGHESSDDDVGLEFDSEGEGAGSANKCSKDTEEFQYEVLSAEEISHHMLDCIKEFNSVANVSALMYLISYLKCKQILKYLFWNMEYYYVTYNMFE